MPNGPSVFARDFVKATQEILRAGVLTAVPGVRPAPPLRLMIRPQPACFMYGAASRAHCRAIALPMPRLPPETIAFLPCSCRSMRSPQSKSLGSSPFIVEPKDFKEVHSAEILRAPGYVPCHFDWREKSFLDPSHLLAMMGRRLPHLAYFAPLREHRILAALPKVLLIFRPQVVLPA